MRLPLHIAFRYFWAKKSTNAISILSWISLMAVAFGVAALVIVLSVFNGFESLVKNLYHSFNSDLQVSPKLGKIMLIDSIQFQRLKKIDGIAIYSTILEQNALIRYRDKQFIATIDGVDSNFQKVNTIQENMYQGVFQLHDSSYCAVIGAGIAQALAINPEMSLEPLQLFSASKSASFSNLDPENAFHHREVFCMGVFAIQQDFDLKYAFVDMQIARELFDQENGFSYINIKLQKNANEKEVIRNLQNLLGNQVVIRNRYQQNAFVYQIMQIEKWVVFAILGFILVIASFNFIGSLSLTAIDKHKDLAVLLALGASKQLVQQIFMFIGAIMVALGTFIGLLIGTLVCLGQQYFQWLHLQGNSFVINTYPVHIQWMDDIYILAIVSIIGFIASWIPARKVGTYVPSLKSNY